jgi:pre-peptidase
MPLNEPKEITVKATPEAGAHTALLRFDDPRTLGLDLAVMNTVVAGTELPGPSYDWSKSGTAQRNEATRYYLTVPEGTKALQVKMSGLATGSQTRFLAFHPYGVGIDSTASTACYANYLNGNGCNPTNRSYANPTPGVWEIVVESRRTSPLQENPWQLDATLLGVTVDPATTTLDSADKGVPTPVSWNVMNDFGQVTASAKGGSLGSAKSARETISNHETKTFTVQVPAGASKLDVKIGNPSDAAADLDLFVTGPGGNKQSADGDSEEAVSYSNPAEGTYTITVDGFAVPAGTTSYDYLDVFFAGALGTITVDEAPFSLANGGSHTVTGTVTANQGVAEGRSLFGAMNVVNESGAVLGTGDVVVKRVTG